MSTAPTKSPWQIINNAGSAVMDSNDLILFAPIPGTPLVTLAKHTTAAGIVTAGAGGVVASGTFLPTAADLVNLTAATPDFVKWIRVGVSVFVGGVITLDPTAAAVTSFTTDLPVPTTANVGRDLGGVFADNVLNH